MRIGSLQVGAEVAKASGTLVSWLSSQLIAFAGGATSAALNFVIAFFGLYYMLRSGTEMWAAARGYIPFSPRTADALRDRFFGVTQATLLGTAIVAVSQGTLIGVGFWVVDLPNPLFGARSPRSRRFCRCSAVDWCGRLRCSSSLPRADMARRRFSS